MWIGNTRTMLVHEEDCEHVDDMLEPEEFSELYHALSSGYSEAGCCLTDNRYQIYQAKRGFDSRRRQRLADRGCSVCAENRCIQRSHIVPRTIGGKVTIPLCPMHHKAYDEGVLHDHEMDALSREHGDIVREMHGMVALLRQGR